MIEITIHGYNFEHDLYALVRSFYPGAETSVSVVETDDTGTGTAFVDIVLEDGHSFHIELDRAPEFEYKRSELKSYVKTMVYNALSEYTGKTLCWGTLTGIRPAKLASGKLEEGCTPEETVKYLEDHYLVSPAKARLACEVAVREKKILEKIDYDKGYSLYIGIPFCPSRCLYCSFTSYPIDKWEKRVDEYVDALLKELEFVSEAWKDSNLQTVYMGGGTPTTLSPSQMDRVLSAVERLFGVDPAGMEFTVEAGRPDSITFDKLKVIYDHGIRRISINPQTMQDRTLELIGRRHSVADVYTAFELARNVGFDNINMDLIVGLPGETYDDVSDTMKQIRTMEPDSLTVHSLAIKRAARLNTMKEVYADYKIENTSEMIDLTAAVAAEMELHPYYMYRQKNMAGNFENVGYSKVDKECIYNILIMEEKQTIVACGAGGSSKIVIPSENRIERIENVKDVGGYIERTDEMIGRKKAFLAEQGIM